MIIEDEPLAAEILTDYIKQVPFLELTHVATDAMYALDLLQQQSVDVIFLDIHLPKLKGIDFLKTLKEPPPVILTTAYQEYALQGYEMNVLDYLLKPIEFSRFLMAVNKLKQKNTSGLIPAAPAERAHFFFVVGKKRVKIFLDEILYIESLKEYIRIVTKDKNILTKFPLGQVEEVLAKNHFLRIHRSYIIATNKVDAFSATDVEVSGKFIPIGRSYKEVVAKVLENGTLQ